jgi:hypothetical protein
MIKQLLAAGSLILLVAAGSPCIGADVEASKGSPSPGTAPGQIVVSTFAGPGGTPIPAEIRIRSAVGEVTFLHRKHIEDRSINCVDCHHQINARKLETPHPEYLTSSWINCKTCHDGSVQAATKSYACSGCHRTNPRNIADETLSAKVVTHKQCWKCHAVGTAKQASTTCESCHSGKKGS